METKKLYKARGGRVLAGVCGGLGEFLGIDPTIVRLVCVLLSLGFGSGLLFYILAALIIPNPPAE